MEFKGTRGKWTTFYDDFNGYGVRLVEEGFSFGMVQIASNINQGDSEGYADAKLISKSPELLQALKEVLKALNVAKNEHGDSTQTFGKSFIKQIELLIKEATTI